jgi:hypothetical protein
MCPFCISTAVLIAGSVISTGGLAAIATKKFGRKNAPDRDKEREKESNHEPRNESKEKGYGNN